MKMPQPPKNEYLRLNAVRQYNLLDTLPEADYDNITQLVSTICKVPISLITLLDDDRNFFKSHHGIPFSESPRSISFCGHAILDKDPIFIVKDARLDERFKDNPLLTEQKAIFYAGVPLINPEGFALGTLCVFDHEPRELTDSQKEALIILGKQVVNLFELRYQNTQLVQVKNELQERNKKLKTFASHVSHDLKSPLANIISLTDFLQDENKDLLSPESNGYISYIQESTTILKDYIDGMLLYYKADEFLNAKKEAVNLNVLFLEIKQILISKQDVYQYTDVGTIQNINKPALTQILINLVDNALKYNESSPREVSIAYTDIEDYHQFTVTDNGIGIEKDKQQTVFELFKTIEGKHKKPSTGIGLSTVENLVEKLGGRITVDSKVGTGSTFTFTITK